MSTNDILAEVDHIVAAHRKLTHEQVMFNRAEESNRTVASRRERDEHLKLIGDSDA